MFGADCTPSALSPQERLARFQEIDAAAQKAFDGGRFAEAAAILGPVLARMFLLGGSTAQQSWFQHLHHDARSWAAGDPATRRRAYA